MVRSAGVCAGVTFDTFFGLVHGIPGIAAFALRPCKPLGRDLSDRTNNGLPFHHSKSANANHAGHLQSAFREVRITLSHDFIKAGDALCRS